jgi:hypothetical protein
MSSEKHLDVSGMEPVKCELGDSLAQAAPKLQGYVRSICRMYARRLRHEYKDNTIRNAFVFETTIRELSRLGYIALVDGRINIPPWLPEALHVGAIRLFPLPLQRRHPGIDVVDPRAFFLGGDGGSLRQPVRTGLDRPTIRRRPYRTSSQ